MNTSVPDEVADKHLYVGNTPPAMSELLIRHFFNAAMRRVGLCEPQDTPVVGGRVNGKFAFVEFASPEMASEGLNLNGIPLLGKVLHVRRPENYRGPAVKSKTWEELTGVSLPEEIHMDPEQDRMSREIFIGNTTPEMNEYNLRDYIGSALMQTGLATMPGNPITACRVSGKFAFIELRSAQEARNSLNLDNIPFMGTALRIGRPAKYTGPPEEHGTWEDILAKYIAGDLHVPGASPSQVEPTSRIIELQNLLSRRDLEDEEEYKFVKDDTYSVCSAFGKLSSVVIPRIGEKGEGKLFLEYATREDAGKAFEALRTRSFDGHHLKAFYFDEARFVNKELA